MAESKITPQQRAQNFGASTRQHWQMIGSQEVSGGGQTVSFRVPKSRILAGFRVMVDGVINGTGYASGLLSPYNIIRRVSVNLNNGFSPIVLSGESLAALNLFRKDPQIVYPKNVLNGNEDCSLCVLDGDGNKARLNSNKDIQDILYDGPGFVKFMIDIPLTLNDRDPVGMILAQNQETAIDLEIDIDSGASIATEVTVGSTKISVGTITYSIPTNANAFPDMSVLKVWHDRRETFSGGGMNHIKLPVGMIYRKLILKLENEDGSPMTYDQITGNIELVLNTADSPYSISPEMLRRVNVSQLGYGLPKGYYAFDFTYQGITNLGGSRDYIDCERVSEFTLRFTPQNAGRATIITEQLSRLV